MSLLSPTNTENKTPYTGQFAGKPTRGQSGRGLVNSPTI